MDGDWLRAYSPRPANNDGYSLFVRMPDGNENSEASLHTVDIESIKEGGPDVPPGQCLCTSCWVLFDGEGCPTCPACGELSSEDGWPTLPFTFLDRYVFLSSLGRGGVGAVFRARHVDPARGDEQFAVKVVQRGAQPERRRLLSQMFEREISAAALLGRSRHFVRVLGHDTGNHLHLAMEYVPWPTLKVLLRNGRMKPRRAAEFGKVMLRAIEVMHAHNLVHRDLKPANIFVNDKPDGFDVKIADLGLWILAQNHRGDVTESLPAGTFAGTLDYASPEQMDGVDIGLPSDLHAVASILWAACVGEVPFPARGESFISSMRSRRQLLEAVPARPHSMPEALYGILAKALQPLPEARFESSREFASALDDYVRDVESYATTVHVPLDSEGPGSTARDKSTSRASKRSVTATRARTFGWRKWALIGGGIAVATTGGFVAMRQSMKSDTATAPASSSAPVTASPSTAPTIAPTSTTATAPTAGPIVRGLVVGPRHSCAVLDDGHARCWGANERGQLGDGTTSSRSTPKAVGGLTDIEELGLGANHTCARTRGGQVWCWGANESGQLGDGGGETRTGPTKVVGLEGITKLFTSDCQTWAVQGDGKVLGWGCNDEGQLGGAAKSPSSKPIEIAPLQGAERIDATGVRANGAACVTLTSGDTHCWSWGRGGLNAAAAFAGLSQIVEVSLGLNHGCARLRDGTLQCFGKNTFGEVGDGTRVLRSHAVVVPNLSGVAQVALGRHHACARLESGEVQCWGRNHGGQVGQRGAEDQTVPARVAGVDAAAELVVDGDLSCARVKDGRVACWGAMGPGSEGDRGELNWLDTFRGANRLATNHNGVICATGSSTGVACRGDDTYGQLGTGRRLESREPIEVPGLGNVSQLMAASRNACAIHDGTLACWGANTWRVFGPDDVLRTAPTKLADDVTDIALGARGIYVFVGSDERYRHVKAGGTLLVDHGVGTSQDLSFPHAVPALDGARQIVVGARHACARMADGTVRCWGDNTLGQIGDGTASKRSTPTPALKVTDVVSVAAGGYHTCALRRDSTVVCWGINENGQAGPGPSWRCEQAGLVYGCVRRPRRVLGLEGVVELSAGQYHTCARMKSGAVQCWGSNKSGQLGDGTKDNRAAPGPVRGLSGVQHVSAGDKHTCTLLEDGTAQCWGDNGSGELGRVTDDKCGDERIACGLTPGLVSDLDGLESVAAGWEFTCARRATGSVWCWGSNQRGTLGDAVTAYREIPVRVAW